MENYDIDILSMLIEAENMLLEDFNKIKDNIIKFINFIINKIKDLFYKIKNFFRKKIQDEIRVTLTIDDYKKYIGNSALDVIFKDGIERRKQEVEREQYNNAGTINEDMYNDLTKFESKFKSVTNREFEIVREMINILKTNMTTEDEDKIRLLKNELFHINFDLEGDMRYEKRYIGYHKDKIITIDKPSVIKYLNEIDKRIDNLSKYESVYINSLNEVKNILSHNSEKIVLDNAKYVTSVIEGLSKGFMANFNLFSKMYNGCITIKYKNLIVK